MHSFRIAVQLVTEPFDVVETVGYYDCILPYKSLDHRVLRCPSIFLRLRVVIHTTIKTKRLIVDVVDRELACARIRRSSDFGLEKVHQLLRAISLA